MVERMIMKVTPRPFHCKRDNTYAGGTLDTTTPIVVIIEIKSVFIVHFRNGTAVKTSR